MAFAQTPGQTAKSEAKYAALIAGMTPGAPVDCIDTRRRDSTLEAFGDRLVYRFGRDRLFVNQTTGGCWTVARGDTLVTRQYTGRLCRGDVARTVDLPSGMETGGCALGAFTPYTRQAGK
jgi:hypothetical protein